MLIADRTEGRNYADTCPYELNRPELFRTELVFIRSSITNIKSQSSKTGTLFLEPYA
jgi:hypothetical protein